MLNGLRRRSRQTIIPTAAPLAVSIGDQLIPLTVRLHPRARRLTLRIARDGSGIVVTLPPHAVVAEAIDLARQHQHWIVQRLAAMPSRIPFVDGAVIPLRGEPHRLRHLPAAARRIEAGNGMIDIGGGSDAFAPRLTGWLKGEARRDLSQTARIKATSLGKRYRRITIRDTRSRWGSCAVNGDLSFSWRLVLAPPPVLDYLVAHEVAHLAVQGHDERFWRTVAGLTGDIDLARHWLRRHGGDLLRYG